MALRIFKSFFSTINPFKPGGILAQWSILVDPTTGAPVGIQSRNASGPDGIWTPVDVTPAQVTNPTAAMLADINATYRLNAPPWTRYTSNGSSLVSSAGGTADVVPATGLFANMIAYSPLTIDQPDGLTVFGQLQVRSFPA